jgi:hypothetical protein
LTAVPSPEVRLDREGHVARVTLDRPRSLNAVTIAMDLELARIWDEIDPIRRFESSCCAARAAGRSAPAAT